MTPRAVAIAIAAGNALGAVVWATGLFVWQAIWLAAVTGLFVAPAMFYRWSTRHARHPFGMERGWQATAEVPKAVAITALVTVLAVWAALNGVPWWLVAPVALWAIVNAWGNGVIRRASRL